MVARAASADERRAAQEESHPAHAALPSCRTSDTALTRLTMQYLTLFSVSIIRLIFEFTSDSPVPKGLGYASRWLILSSGLVDALVYVGSVRAGVGRASLITCRSMPCDRPFVGRIDHVRQLSSCSLYAAVYPSIARRCVNSVGDATRSSARVVASPTPCRSSVTDVALRAAAEPFATFINGRRWRARSRHKRRSASLDCLASSAHA